MKLGCADFTWPLMRHEAVLRHIRSLDIPAVDLGIFGNRSHLRPEVIRQDPAWWAGRIRERLDELGLEVADVFLVPWTTMERMAANHPDRREVADGHALFLDILEFARRLGVRGMTMNGGTAFADDSPTASIKRSSDELKRRVDAAGKFGMQVRIEGSVGSNTETPAKLLELIGLTPGLKATVDYCHFVFQGIAQSEAEALLVHAGHIQCRGAAPGRMQVPFAENEIDYGRMIDRLLELDYDGFFSIEYVWMKLWDCNRTENTMETIAFRDFASARIAGRPYEPPTMAI